MPYHRRHSRSRSPSRTDRYQRRSPYNDRARSSRSPSYRRDRSRSRDRRRPDRQRRDYDIDRERQKARERGLRDSTDHKRKRDRSRDDRSERRGDSDRHRHDRARNSGKSERQATAERQVEPSPRRLDDRSQAQASRSSPGHSTVEAAPVPQAADKKPRKSRFDQPTTVESGEQGKQPSTEPTDNQVASEEEKLRIRQERIAQWKRKKAQESRKDAPLGSIQGVGPVEQAQSQSQNASSTILPDSHRKTTLGKFGLQQSAQAAQSAIKKTFDFDINEEVVKKSRALPDLHSEDHQDDDDDETDPLDAFMVMNQAAHTQRVTTARRSGDILNASDTDGESIADEEDILEEAARRINAKKKDIVGTDHSRQEYEAFRKDFYVEPEELVGLTDEEVDAMRLELDGIVIRGKDCPKPITNWGQCGLSAATLDTIKHLGYDQPTSIQAQAIPAIMSGRDAIGVAKTGSGKTVAFLLPMFRHIKDQRPIEPKEGPIAMILTPTRELATQIYKECKPFLKALDLRAVCAYGGPPIKDQIADFKRGTEIVVCTPGRMIDILAANSGRVTNLQRVTYCVLDEADRMFDLGFEPQVMKILNNIRPQRQTVLFSATFPKSMEALARKILRGKPLEITVGARSVVAPEITQIVEVRPPDDPSKFNRVLEILGNFYLQDEDALTLIFVDRQEAADSLLAQLMRKGYPCNSLHGGKDQSDRDSTISDFKAGIFPVLIATSVAARGLDVKQLKLVINFDCPNHMEDYVHRVGRTGRAGNKGTAITFVGEDQERYAYDIAKALRLSQVEIPEPLKKVSDAFAAKVKLGLEKSTAAGFGGKGLAKFDSTRDMEKKLQRKLYGDDDEEEEEKKDPAADDQANAEEAEAVLEGGSSARADAPIKVERVTSTSKLAGKRGGVGTKVLNPVAAARARIDAINNRIRVGGRPMDQVASNPDAGEYRAMMEINDYPQKARWNVTNRTNIAKILEATGTSITTQGQYIRPGSNMAPGTPKLYLLIEGPTEMCVTEAVKELRRLLSEGTMQDIEAGTTRYKVI